MISADNGFRDFETKGFKIPNLNTFYRIPLSFLK